MALTPVNRLDAWFVPIQPAITQLEPGEAFAGSPSFQILVTGDNFLPESILRWNGSDRQTSYISSTELTAVIPGSDIRNAGTPTITVANVLSGETSESDPRTFTIQENALIPVIHQLNPSEATEGGPPFILYVTGNRFLPNATIRWNHSDRPTSYISTSELSAEISAADITSSGVSEITVVNRNSDNNVFPSNPLSFIIHSREAMVKTVPALSEWGIILFSCCLVLLAVRRLKPRT
jgi:hypothetical protein